jgi:hypothetical protein
MDKNGWAFNPRTISGRDATTQEVKGFSAPRDGLNSLTRELIQNSKDVPDGSGKPVLMVAEVGEIPSDVARKDLYLDELEEHIKGSTKMSGDSKDDVNKNRVLKQCHILDSQEPISYFKFSDFNTIGLKGCNIPYTEDREGDKKDSAFWALVCDEGVSIGKGQNSAGGMGVGKAAFFPASSLFTVFYSSVIPEGSGMAGVTIQPTNWVGETKYEGKGYFAKYTPAGVGYDPESLRGISQQELAGKAQGIFERTEVGTDVVIFGINQIPFFSEDDSWAWQFAYFAIANFYAAFLTGKIELAIKDHGHEVIHIYPYLDQNHPGNVVEILDQIVAKKISSISNQAEETRWFINAFMGNGTNVLHSPIRENVDSIGKISIYINWDKEVQEKRFVILRSGMATYSDTVRAADQNFVCCVAIEDDSGSDFLENCESPKHDSYDPEDHNSDPDKNRKIRRILDIFIKTIRDDIIKTVLTDSKKSDLRLLSLDKYVFAPESEEENSDPLDAEMSIVPNTSMTRKQAELLRVTKGKVIPGGDDQNTQDHTKDTPSHHIHDKKDQTTNNQQVEDPNSPNNVRVPPNTKKLPLQYRVNYKEEQLEFAIDASSSDIDPICVELRAVGEDNTENGDLPNITEAIDENAQQPVTIKSWCKLEAFHKDSDGIIRGRVKFAGPQFSNFLLNSYFYPPEATEPAVSSEEKKGEQK